MRVSVSAACTVYTVRGAAITVAAIKRRRTNDRHWAVRAKNSRDGDWRPNLPSRPRLGHGPTWPLGDFPDPPRGSATSAPVDETEPRSFQRLPGLPWLAWEPRPQRRLGCCGDGVPLGPEPTERGIASPHPGFGVPCFWDLPMGPSHFSEPKPGSDAENREYCGILLIKMEQEQFTRQLRMLLAPPLHLPDTDDMLSSGVDGVG